MTHNRPVGVRRESVPILYISLREDEDRRQHLRQQLDRFGLDAEWVPAVNAQQLAEDVGGAVGLSRGQVACWMSHRKAWQRAHELGLSEVCILEDDLYWLADPGDYLSAGFLSRHDLELLQLGSISFRFPEHSASMTLAKQVSLAAHGARRINRRFSELDARIRAHLIRRSARALGEYLTEGGVVQLVPREFGAGTHAYVISMEGITTLEQTLSDNPARSPIDGYLSEVAARSVISTARLNPGLSTQHPFTSRIR